MLLSVGFNLMWLAAESDSTVIESYHSDLCVLLCGSLFRPVVRDFAQKIPKIAERAKPQKSGLLRGTTDRL